MKNNITRCRLFWLSILMVFLLSCGGGNSSSKGTAAENPRPENPPTPVSPGQNLQDRIEAYLLEDQPENGAGVSVLVMKDGEVVCRASRGMANIQADIELASNTGFRLASVSKSFTALAIMQLVEDQLLQLEDSVLDYIPEFSESWRPISIEMLLVHQSGIYDSLNDHWPNKPSGSATNAETIAHFAQHPELEFTPGSKTDYSNTGYVVLAEIIQRITGYSFSDYMELHIFDPAGMRDSYINDESRALASNDALNHANTKTYYGRATYLSGNMGQVSSTEDFVAFFNALREGTLVSDETLQAMLEPKVTVFGNIKYGLGFMLRDTDYGHGGYWDGFRTDFSIDPNLNLEFVVLSNGGNSTQPHLAQIRRIVYDFY